MKHPVIDAVYSQTFQARFKPSLLKRRRQAEITNPQNIAVPGPITTAAEECIDTLTKVCGNQACFLGT